MSLERKIGAQAGIWTRVLRATAAYTRPNYTTWAQAPQQYTIIQLINVSRKKDTVKLTLLNFRLTESIFVSYTHSLYKLLTFNIKAPNYTYAIEENVRENKCYYEIAKVDFR